MTQAVGRGVNSVPPASDASEHEANLVEQLLRAPGAFLETTREGDLVPLLRGMLLTVTLGAGAFGAVVGAHRGGVQMLYAAVKVPLMLLGTMAICAPAFIGLARALGVRLPAREVVTVSLGACARAALVLAGLAPVLWLFEGFMGYHSVALAITGGCAVAGGAAAGLLLRGLRRGGGGWAAGLAFLAVFGVVGSQTGWLLRPFLVRPRTTTVPFVRGLEGDLLDAVRRSSRSAAGVYDRDDPDRSTLDNTDHEELERADQDGIQGETRHGRRLAPDARSRAPELPRPAPAAGDTRGESP